MIPTRIVLQLGDDADLLTKSDRWLEAKQTSLHQKLAIIIEDLKILDRATLIKQSLQQTNRVAVRFTEYNNNRPVDEIIQVMPLPDAMTVLRKQSNNTTPQLRTWIDDGYDVQTASTMR